MPIGPPSHSRRWGTLHPTFLKGLWKPIVATLNRFPGRTGHVDVAAVWKLLKIILFAQCRQPPDPPKADGNGDPEPPKYRRTVLDNRWLSGSESGPVGHPQ